MLKTSQIETGNGITTGFLQVLAEELDMDMSQMRYGMFNANSHTVVDTWVAAQHRRRGRLERDVGHRPEDPQRRRARASVAARPGLDAASASRPRT